MTPDTLVALANLTVPRKPDRGPTIRPDPLTSTATAANALGLSRLDATQLAALRELHLTIVQLVDGLLRAGPVAQPAARLAQLAQPSTARVRIDVGENRTLRPRLEWSDPTPVATLARRVALELAEIDIDRLGTAPGLSATSCSTTRLARARGDGMLNRHAGPASASAGIEPQATGSGLRGSKGER